ncbi:MAG TPA: histidine phosphatase family protein [Candidatus Saccharimonadales bacterium]|nr:histidine phosphatase family protein [Candidatus Saccharimonadales bacterium]
MIKTNKRVYLVRHGQSMDNASPVFQSVDSPLSPLGTQQASTIADRLSHIKFEALISSPVLRARQTANKISSITGKDVEISDLFVERIKPSQVDGKPYSDRVASEKWRDWEKTLYQTKLKFSDGESYDDLLKRADKAIKFLEKRMETTMTVVSHGYFLRVLIARIIFGEQLTGPLLKKFIENTSIENTAITVIDYRDAFEEEHAWRLWTLNDHSHFAE